jgi:hypothetical protein
MTSELVTVRHLGRKAVIYIRQSTPQPHGSPHLEWGANEKSASVWQYRI